MFLSPHLDVADTLRNHHGMRHLKLPERVVDRYVFESLAGEDQFHAALPGDDITNHPGNVYANNPFMRHAGSIIRIRRMYLDGKFDPYPMLKKACEQFLVVSGEGVASYVMAEGQWVFRIRDSVNGPAGG